MKNRCRLHRCYTILIALIAGTFFTPHAALANNNNLCGPSLNATLNVGYECINDTSMLVAKSSKLGWHYAPDSTKDGVSGNSVGGNVYELHGLAWNETATDVVVAICGNNPIGGNALAGAQNGTIAHGDLFLNLTNQNFLTASNNSALYAVRYSAANDSGASQLGVYKNVKAKSVTSVNSGFATLSAYESRVTSLGGIVGYGELPATQTYYDKNISLNVIDQGTYLGPISLLTAAELTGFGFNGSTMCAGAAHTIAFKFQKSLIVDPCGVIGGDGSSCRDCAGVFCGTTKRDQCGVCGGNNSTCLDCKGIPNGPNKVDQCGVCGGNNSTCLDCKGVPNGTAKVDQCGVCGGNNSTCLDCKGVPNGTAKVDQCGVCGGNNSTCLDCKGVPNGTAKVDQCGVCGGNNSTCLDCKGVPNGTAKVDQCGVCGGNNSTCLDCKGVPNGTAKVDQCGVCGGNNSTCLDCKGVPNGTSKVDQCGVCGGNGTTCLDCKGVPNGTSKVDQCGVCGGNGTTCLDCKGVPNGTSKVDQCGVCGGNGTTCLDCKGVPNGTSKVDQCGVCGGNGTTCLDCKGVPNGTSKVDQCGVCGGNGSTCLDCKGVLNGTSKADQCGVCGGDGTSCLDCKGVANGTSKVDQCGVCGGDGSTCLDCNGVPNGGANNKLCGACHGKFFQCATDTALRTPDDADGDGISNAVEGLLDTDGDGTPNSLDVDSDGDGVPDCVENYSSETGTLAALLDSDSDKTPDYLDVDSDGDGLSDNSEAWDRDSDGFVDLTAVGKDSDGDGLDDIFEGVYGSSSLNCDWRTPVCPEGCVAKNISVELKNTKDAAVVIWERTAEYAAEAAQCRGRNANKYRIDMSRADERLLRIRQLLEQTFKPILVSCPTGNCAVQDNTHVLTTLRFEIEALYAEQVAMKKVYDKRCKKKGNGKKSGSGKGRDAKNKAVGTLGGLPGSSTNCR